jgi:HEPN domain-containing protein
MLEHEKWLRIAQEDLLAAKELIKVELFSTVTYHCQQSAEKALKGYLAFKNHEVLKSHDLNKLVGSCKKFDVLFDQLYDAANNLNPYLTRFRYPTEFDIPDFAESKQAIAYAQTVMKFVFKKISEKPTGQTDIFLEND